MKIINVGHTYEVPNFEEKDNKEALNCSIDNKDDCESCGS